MIDLRCRFVNGRRNKKSEIIYSRAKDKGPILHVTFLVLLLVHNTKYKRRKLQSSAQRRNPLARLDREKRASIIARR